MNSTRIELAGLFVESLAESWQRDRPRLHAPTNRKAQELTTTPLNLGTLGAKSARNVKLVEDILTPLGITIPYITDGGNLTLEFTIQAD